MTINLLYRGPSERGKYWQELVTKKLPEVIWHSWPNIDDPHSIDIIVAWIPPRNYQTDYPNLKVLYSVGAGVDQFNLATVPEYVQVVRMLDPAISEMMNEYILTSVLCIHRGFPSYFNNNQLRNWQPLKVKKTHAQTVGILGMGNLGLAAAKRLTPMGFKVIGWSRNSKVSNQLEVGKNYYGAQQLNAFLGQTNILVCLLPLTDETRGILNQQTLSMLPKGASVVNVGRGQHIVVNDLINLLDKNHLSTAILDVFEKEPLDPNSPLWDHPNILITPHVAANTQDDSAGQVLLKNLLRYLNSQQMTGIVDRKLGY